MPIISILIHVPDWRAATEWYAAAFPTATRYESITPFARQLGWTQAQRGE